MKYEKRTGALPTLDEYFDQWPETRLLRENLMGNIEALFPEMTQQDRETFMRMNLIMIRQCMRDCGIQ